MLVVGAGEICVDYNCLSYLVDWICSINLSFEAWLCHQPRQTTHARHTRVGNENYTYFGDVFNKRLQIFLIKIRIPSSFQQYMYVVQNQNVSLVQNLENSHLLFFSLELLQQN